MHTVSLQQAVKMTGKSESTLRRDVKKGKVSATRDDRNHFQFDVSELQRAYGELTTTNDADQSTDLALPTHDNAREIALLENNLADLRNQLEISNLEKTVLLEMLAAEKVEKRQLRAEKQALMPAPKEKRNWLFSFFRLPITSKSS